MTRDGFEALVDGILLLTVLLAATGVVQTFAGAAPAPAPPSAYAEDFRTALFRSTLDGLAYIQAGTRIEVRNGTSVEAFLRLQVHAVQWADVDFAEANRRVAALAGTLVRPGWSVAVLGGPVGGEALVHIPSVEIPGNHVRSSWSYPPLRGPGPGVALAVALWVSPPR